MHFSTLITAFAATARAYEAVLYEEGGYLGREASFSFDGHHPLDFNAHSWEWISGWNDGCCIRFCYENEPVGYRCDGDENYRSSSPIDKVVTGCGDTLLNC